MLLSYHILCKLCRLCIYITYKNNKPHHPSISSHYQLWTVFDYIYFDLLLSSTRMLIRMLWYYSVWYILIWLSVYIWYNKQIKTNNNDDSKQTSNKQLLLQKYRVSRSMFLKNKNVSNQTKNIIQKKMFSILLQQLRYGL